MLTVRLCRGWFAGERTWGGNEGLASQRAAPGAKRRFSQRAIHPAWAGGTTEKSTEHRAQGAELRAQSSGPRAEMQKLCSRLRTGLSYFRLERARKQIKGNSIDDRYEGHGRTGARRRSEARQGISVGIAGELPQKLSCRDVQVASGPGARRRDSRSRRRNSSIRAGRGRDESRSAACMRRRNSASSFDGSAGLVITTSRTGRVCGRFTN